jgi:predicted acylesterase/phospholipase RssA
MSSAPEDTNRPAAQNASASENPYCNIVMKGGITSGVVYPRAVAELAETYHLKNIGGTSAGAIAAGMAAAAEFGRAGGGFQRMLDYAGQANRILLSLFQPTPCLRPLFQALLATLGGKPWCLKLAAISIRLACGYWLTSLAGMALACAAALAACWLATGEVVCHALWAAPIGLVPALIWRLRRAVVHDLPRQFFGLCPGVTQPGKGHPMALTDWLADALDGIAGVRHLAERDPDRPLTFGDLHGGNPDDPAIRLLVMTTNLTEGRPYRIPFDDRKFLFRPDEFRRLFPPRIVDWMIGTSQEFDGDPDYRYLPETADLPVIVAVRMSLSFPVLLAAVPLHARDFRQPDDTEKERPRRQWFSDGGISSNFPIHFFDAIWPRWPTFGVKLDAFDPQVHQEQRIGLPVKAGQGLLLPFRRVESLGQFLGAMLDAMQEWRENLQSILPGYRERIVHVRLAEHEGGLNLNMPPETIAQLSEYGRQAGRKLREDFDWDAHRWRRYLVAMARLDEMLDDFRESYIESAPGDEPLKDFLRRYRDDPAEYDQTKAWNAAAEQDIEDLMRCHELWLSRKRLQEGKIPKPSAELRMTPRV